MKLGVGVYSCNSSTRRKEAEDLHVQEHRELLRRKKGQNRVQKQSTLINTAHCKTRIFSSSGTHSQLISFNQRNITRAKETVQQLGVWAALLEDPEEHGSSQPSVIQVPGYPTSSSALGRHQAHMGCTSTHACIHTYIQNTYTHNKCGSPNQKL